MGGTGTKVHKEPWEMQDCHLARSVPNASTALQFIPAQLALGKSCHACKLLMVPVSTERGKSSWSPLKSTCQEEECSPSHSCGLRRHIISTDPWCSLFQTFGDSRPGLFSSTSYVEQIPGWELCDVH